MAKFEPKEGKYTKTFTYELLYYSSLFVFVLGLHMILKARVPSRVLPIFLIPYLVVCFLRLLMGFSEDVAYIPHPIYHFLESI
jgi:hypothetical protein